MLKLYNPFSFLIKNQVPFVSLQLFSQFRALMVLTCRSVPMKPPMWLKVILPEEKAVASRVREVPPVRLELWYPWVVLLGNTLILKVSLVSYVCPGLCFETSFRHRFYFIHTIYCLSKSYNYSVYDE